MKEIKREEEIFRNYLSALRQAVDEARALRAELAAAVDEARALRAELAAIEAIQMENGQWLYPFYIVGSARYLPRDDWIQARKLIGKHIKELP